MCSELAVACQNTIKVYNTDTGEMLACFSSTNGWCHIEIGHYFYKFNFRFHSEKFGLLRKRTTPLCRTGIWYYSGIQLVVKGTTICLGNTNGEWLHQYSIVFHAILSNTVTYFMHGILTGWLLSCCWDLRWKSWTLEKFVFVWQPDITCAYIVFSFAANALKTWLEYIFD